MANRRARRSLALLAVGWLAPLLFGCAAWPPPPEYAPPELAGQQQTPPSNPVFVAVNDGDIVWEQLVDVVDDYFKIQREDRVQRIGDTLTEGRLETLPRGASTLAELWGYDSVTPYDKFEATLQSQRRSAVARVIPATGGFLVEVIVTKELEDVGEPEFPTPGRLNLRNDASIHRLNSSVGGDRPSLGWIPKGRDVNLEQTILAELQNRLGGVSQTAQF